MLNNLSTSSPPFSNIPSNESKLSSPVVGPSELGSLPLFIGGKRGTLSLEIAVFPRDLLLVGVFMTACCAARGGACRRGDDLVGGLIRGGLNCLERPGRRDVLPAMDWLDRRPIRGQLCFVGDNGALDEVGDTADRGGGLERRIELP